MLICFLNLENLGIDALLILMKSILQKLLEKMGFSIKTAAHLHILHY